jgi:tetratricopeptide (TPR) repeat protein
VIFSRRSNALAMTTVTAIVALVMTATAARDAGAQSRRSEAYPRTSISGSYLAARHAGMERDAAAAASYYRAALRGDPRNPELLARAFLAVLPNGDVAESIRLAERVLQADKSDKVARLVLGVRSIKQKQYSIARQQLSQSVRGAITDLTATLLTAWTQANANEYRTAIETLDKLSGPEWYGIFKDLHGGLILEHVGQRREAGKRYERAHKTEGVQLRVVQAYGGYLARTGNREEALKVFQGFEDVLPRHPLVTDAMADIKAGKRLPPLVDTVQAGAAEVLYGLGGLLARRGGGEDLGLIYLQLALYLAPSHPMALLSLADLYEQVKKLELAIKTYERIPTSSPLHRNAQIQRATDLDGLERTDEAKEVLNKLIADHPSDLEAIMALGNIMRSRKQFAECAETYGKAIDLIDKPEKPNWTVFYFRGICHERSKQWPKAEADLKKALELFPDQPHVLNYLGYSWVDQGVNLDEGMRMIRRAVEQRPDDGYIVDSLGWAYYRIGNYEEAVRQLDKAVELKPEDPTINDHLGDAYWKVGRHLEARFQWTHARDLKPEPDDLEKIEAKLKSGLPEEPSSAAEADRPKKPGGG